MDKWQNFSGARGFDGGLYQSGFPALVGRAVVRQGNGVVLGVDGAALSELSSGSRRENYLRCSYNFSVSFRSLKNKQTKVIHKGTESFQQPRSWWRLYQSVTKKETCHVKLPSFGAEC